MADGLWLRLSWQYQDVPPRAVEPAADDDDRPGRVPGLVDETN